MDTKILSNLNEGVIYLDKTLKITYLNLAAKKILKSNELSEGIELSSGKELPLAFKDLLDKQSFLSCKKKETFKKSIRLNDKYLDVVFVLEGSGFILILQERVLECNILNVGKDFIANASHEFKTPLTVIKGFAETLKDVTDLSSKMVKMIAEKILKTSTRLEHIVRDLLVLADIDNMQNANFTNCSLNEVIKTAVELVKSAHKKGSIKVFPMEDTVFFRGKRFFNGTCY